MRRITKSDKEMEALAGEYARKFLSVRETRVVALKGNLGAGKTTFTRGILKELGVRGRVTSPTFVLIKIYKPKKIFKKVYHIDAYRLKIKKDLDLLGWEKIIREEGVLILIEWPEMVKGIGIDSCIEFDYGMGERERVVCYNG